jgi:hypothetical protein
MKNFINNLDELIVGTIEAYNNPNNNISLEKNTNILIDTLSGMYGNLKEVKELVECIKTLTINDLDVGDAYYTKTDGKPTLKKFMVNEARLRQANESRGRMKNQIDNLLTLVAGESSFNSINIRITNIDSFSAYIDRLSTERIKEYNFKFKQNKIEEANHQLKVVDEIKLKIGKLFNEINTQEGYNFIGEKRTFDEQKLIKDVSQILKDIKND